MKERKAALRMTTTNQEPSPRPAERPRGRRGGGPRYGGISLRHADRSELDALYTRYNRREYVHPDPMEVLYEYPAVRDREIVGLVASHLAYGRVAQILKSVHEALERMGPSPAAFLESTPERQIGAAFAGFKHRFTTGSDMAALLQGIRRVLRSHGSLNAAFCAGLSGEDDTVVPALTRFVGQVAAARPMLMPCPTRGSACKRLHLYLRWMVRSDAVDPGGWQGVPPAKLVIPLDTHMHRIARRLGLTRCNAADLKTAIEITHGFRRWSPDDPVKYDFVLTRLGIRTDSDAWLSGDAPHALSASSGSRPSARRSSPRGSRPR